MLREVGCRSKSAAPARPPAVDWRSKPRLSETRYVGEIAAKQMLRDIGVRVPRGGFAASLDEALRIADSIGYPVALKSASSGVVHKSDVGGVRLDLCDSAELCAAWIDMAAALSARGVRHDEGGLIEEMIAGVGELIVGARFDPEFGPVVMFGTGGIFVELLRDVRIAPVPISEHEATEMLRSLRHWPILDGARGRPKADITAAARVAAQLSAFAYARGPELLEFDINPLIVLPDGGGAVAVDARATVAIASLDIPANQRTDLGR
ncbi:MAG: acetate--CoA ligase family protein [Alphaproteobacteria bacterium]